MLLVTGSEVDAMGEGDPYKSTRSTLWVVVKHPVTLPIVAVNDANGRWFDLTPSKTRLRGAVVVVFEMDAINAIHSLPSDSFVIAFRVLTKYARGLRTRSRSPFRDPMTES